MMKKFSFMCLIQYIHLIYSANKNKDYDINKLKFLSKSKVIEYVHILLYSKNTND